MRWICLICLGLLFGSETSTIADMLDGAEAYDRGDYLRAMEEWLPYAAQNDANALYNLGQLYRQGKGVEPDLERAEYYYLQAAELDNVLAQGNLGTMYYFAPPPIGNVEKAIHWWTKAARKGYAPAQHSLGLLYLNGDHVPQDQVKAYAWLHLAAQANLEQAMAVEKELTPMMTPDQIAAAKDLAPDLLEKEEPFWTTIPPSIDISLRPEEKAVATTAEALQPQDQKKIPSSRIKPVAQKKKISARDLRKKKTSLTKQKKADLAKKKKKKKKKNPCNVTPVVLLAHALASANQETNNLFNLTRDLGLNLERKNQLYCQ